jgi:glycosyltransferase involved in cell wall biosynthesis
MWAKNGAETLPVVLKRLEEVIPKENINQRIFVDDHSEDDSIAIARSFNWKVYENQEGGIASGASIALEHVTTPLFVSVEQDLLLAKNWWTEIPKYMNAPDVAVAKGVRLPTNPVLRSLYEYELNRFGASKLAGMDNNIYRTRIITQLGGFPTECPICVDLNLKDRIKEAGYKWVTDETVVSDHIRKGVLQETLHKRRMQLMASRRQEASLLRLLMIFALSPRRALHVALRKRCPQIFFVYPFLRFMTLKTFFDKRRIMRQPISEASEYT